jgi:hypothetical protein
MSTQLFGSGSILSNEFCVHGVTHRETDSTYDGLPNVAEAKLGQ